MAGMAQRRIAINMMTRGYAALFDEGEVAEFRSFAKGAFCHALDGGGRAYLRDRRYSRSA